MFKTHEEYVDGILRAPYKLYENSDRITKKYINMSVGFYGGCSYHPSGWDATFRTLRENFPTEPLVIFQDGYSSGNDYSDMASKYNASYVVENSGIYLYWPKVEQTWTYLQWILKAADICRTEWLVQLHPDNIINDRFHILPPGPLCGVSAGTRSGRSGNPLPEAATQYLLQNTTLRELNGYGWCGGGCIHVPTYRNIMREFTFERLVYIHENISKVVTLNEDVFLPFLFNLYGFPYRVWLDIEECENRGYAGAGVSAAIQHGTKKYYAPSNISHTVKIVSEVCKEKGIKCVCDLCASGSGPHIDK